jgi:predicted unusual protein kinase regulating ubiquinone biosynthesis (AarF/ABC1/UbiB family)
MAQWVGSDGIPTGRLRRAAPVATLAAQGIGETVIATLRRGRSVTPEEYTKRAERYVELLGRSKGALMKMGQILSYVPFGSAVPPENRVLFQAAMSRLQANAPPMAPELAAQVITEELGGDPEAVFAEFSPSPLAAASIGQVHSARLRDGRPVAIKIQYPGAAEAIRADLRNTELVGVFLQLLRSVVPGLSRIDPKEVAAEVSDRLTEELDYRLEASNQQLFAETYRDHPFIFVPQVIPELSTGRVLTQELAEGLPWAEAVEAREDLRNSWAEVIYRFAFGSLRRLSAFNVDPHPGNYLFRLDGSVAFLDFGCVKRYDADQLAQMRSLLRAMVAGDARTVWNIFAEIGFFDVSNAPTPDEVMAWYGKSFAFLLEPQPFTMTQEFIAKMIEAVYSPTGPSGHIIRKANPPRDYIFMSRIDMGLMSVFAELNASANWRAIQAEMDDGAAPSTAIGTADAEFWVSRGAPLSP